MRIRKCAVVMTLVHENTLTYSTDLHKVAETLLGGDGKDRKRANKSLTSSPLSTFTLSFNSYQISSN